jgi:hypothetical protein
MGTEFRYSDLRVRDIQLFARLEEMRDDMVAESHGNYERLSRNIESVEAIARVFSDVLEGRRPSSNPVKRKQGVTDAGTEYVKFFEGKVYFDFALVDKEWIFVGADCS